MAGKGSKKDIETVLMQAMLAAKTVRAQRDRLQQLQHRLQDLQADAALALTPAPADADKQDKLGDLASNLFKVYYIGLEAGARMLTACIEIAAEKGIRLSPPNMAFAVMNDEQLHGALLAQQFPARPRSQAQGLDRVMAAVLAIKLLEEHLLPRCVECLTGDKAPVPGKTPDSSSPDSSPDSSPNRDDDDPDTDPVAAAAEALAKVDLSDDMDAAKTAKSGSSKPREAASGGGGRGEVDKALDYMYRANRIASLAVKHIDVAVSVLSRFMDPKKLASLADFCADYAYISEGGFYLASE